MPYQKLTLWCGECQGRVKGDHFTYRHGVPYEDFKKDSRLWIYEFPEVVTEQHGLRIYAVLPTCQCGEMMRSIAQTSELDIFQCRECHRVIHADYSRPAYQPHVLWLVPEISLP